MLIDIIVGISFLVIGVCFFYLPYSIIKLYQLIKKSILNEKNIILHRKKIGLFFVLLGLLLVFVYFKNMFSKNVLYNAYREYYLGNFVKAENYCLQVLNKKPNDIEATFLLGKIYFTAEKYLVAKSVFLKLNDLNTPKKFQVEKYLETIDKKIKK
ncbi:MAG: hypothetical protein N2643_05205 [Endomicrobia bacterium]|nr:hypothetical protein [Endomicrobiia bacterium]